MPTQSTGAIATTPIISPKAAVQVRLAENVDLETISNIVRGIGGHYGCLTCGLAGVDLTLSGDPVEAATFSQLPGVRSVSFE